MHKKLIASEMHKMGFEISIWSTGVVVMLKNRIVSQMEVRNALSDAFDGIEFELTNTTHGVLVSA